MITRETVIFDSLPFYGLPKVHKVNTPLRPIASSIGIITYASAKYLADVLLPIVGKTEHHVKNSKDFAEYVKTTSPGRLN